MNPLAQTLTSEPPTASAAPSTGTEKIGRFELVKEIGKGSMGVVYLARDPMIGRWVAVKKLTGIKGKLLEPDVVRQLLINEARNVGALEHTGIVTVFDLIEDREGRVEALAMEYVAGESLRQRLGSPAPLSLNYTSEIVSEVASVLDYAHENGCIHRDVKPANILLGEDGAIKVADFGIAALRGEDLAAELRNLGTPNYLAPERVLGQPGDQHTDIYSLGVILYELLTRHVPFEATTIAELVQKIIEEDPTPAERHVPELMPGLCTILERALAKAPEDRYETAGALAADLREIVAAQASLNDTVPAPVTPRLTARDRLELDSEVFVPVDATAESVGCAVERLVATEPDWEPAAEASPESTPEVVEWDTAGYQPVEPVVFERPPVLSEVSEQARPVSPTTGGHGAKAVFRSAVRHGRRVVASLGRVATLAVSAAGPAVARGRAALGDLPGRPVLAAALVFAISLPVLLLLVGGSTEARVSPATVEAEPDPRQRYLDLVVLSLESLAAGDHQVAGDLVKQADALFPDTRDEIRGEALIEVAVVREAERLARVDAIAEEAHLQIARTDFAAAARSIAELTELEAPEELLSLLYSSLQQSSRRARQAARDRQPAQEPVAPAEAPQPEPEVVAVAAVAPPPKTGPGSLEVEFSSARARGVLTIYTGERQILSRRFRFVEKKSFLVRKGVSGSFSEGIELPNGTHELKIYLSQPRQPTQLRTLEVQVDAGDSRTLGLRVQADGRLVVGAR